MTVRLAPQTWNHTHAWVTSVVVGLSGNRWLRVSYKASIPQWVVTLSTSHMGYMTLSSLDAIKGTFWQSAACVLQHAYHFVRLVGVDIKVLLRNTHPVLSFIPSFFFILDKEKMWRKPLSGRLTGIRSTGFPREKEGGKGEGIHLPWGAHNPKQKPPKPSSIGWVMM